MWRAAKFSQAWRCQCCNRGFFIIPWIKESELTPPPHTHTLSLSLFLPTSLCHSLSVIPSLSFSLALCYSLYFCFLLVLSLPLFLWCISCCLMSTSFKAWLMKSLTFTIRVKKCSLSFSLFRSSNQTTLLRFCLPFLWSATSCFPFIFPRPWRQMWGRPSEVRTVDLLGHLETEKIGVCGIEGKPWPQHTENWEAVNFIKDIIKLPWPAWP